MVPASNSPLSEGVALPKAKTGCLAYPLPLVSVLSQVILSASCNVYCEHFSIRRPEKEHRDATQRDRTHCPSQFECFLPASCKKCIENASRYDACKETSKHRRSDIKYVRLKIPTPVPSRFRVEFLLLSASSSRTLRLDASLFPVKKQIQKHSDQEHIVFYTICATAHHKPAFTAMHHDDTQHEDRDRNNSRCFDITVQDEQNSASHMRQLNRPGNDQSERRKAKRIEVELPEIVDAAGEHAGHTMHQQDHSKCEPQNECGILKRHDKETGRY